MRAGARMEREEVRSVSEDLYDWVSSCEDSSCSKDTWPPSGQN